MKPSLAELRAMFKDAGLRHTRQRERVFCALAASKRHPTAEELFVRVRHEEPGLSLATIYNTLDAFCAAGLARKLPAADGKGPCRFDADMSDHVHISLPDGRVLDLPADLGARIAPEVTQDLLAEIRERLGIDVSQLSVHISAQLAD